MEEALLKPSRAIFLAYTSPADCATVDWPWAPVVRAGSSVAVNSNQDVQSGESTGFGFGGLYAGPEPVFSRVFYLFLSPYVLRCSNAIKRVSAIYNLTERLGKSLKAVCCVC